MNTSLDVYVFPLRPGLVYSCSVYRISEFKLHFSKHKKIWVTHDAEILGNKSEESSFYSHLPNNVNLLDHEKVRVKNKKKQSNMVCGLFQLSICVAQLLDWA